MAAAVGDGAGSESDGAGSDGGAASEGLATTVGGALGSELGPELAVGVGAVEASPWLGSARMVEQPTIAVLSAISATM